MRSQMLICQKRTPLAFLSRPRHPYTESDEQLRLWLLIRMLTWSRLLPKLLPRRPHGIAQILKLWNGW